jgi:hypothetical protein
LRTAKNVLDKGKFSALTIKIFGNKKKEGKFVVVNGVIVISI